MFSLNGTLLGGTGLGKAEMRRRFAREESGSFTILNLTILMVVMMVAGIAVDAVRFEAKRARLQNTLDRAILAAADMGQTLTPAQVVASYFEKAGLSDYYAEPYTTSGFNSKTVSATATGQLDTIFMRMLGINTLAPHAAGTAEESISDIEISLVLDVSGSMGQPVYEDAVGYSRRYGSYTYKRNTGQTKLESMQNAAKEFVDTIFSSTVDARTSMSIVPYNMQVNAGPDLVAWYNLTNQNSRNSCVDFTTAQFGATALSTTSSLYRSDVFDDYGRSMPINDYGECPTTSSSEVMVLEDNKEDLKTKIGNLTSGGNTSIEIGMKWGVTLMDPSAQPAIVGMIAAGKVAPSFAGRPYSYANTDTMKVIVVMTDGINTQERILKDAYRGQNSGVYRWWNGSSWRYSVYMPEGNNDNYDGDGYKNETYRRLNVSSGTDRWSNTPEGGAGATQLTYYELWQLMSFEYHARYFRRNAWYNDPFNENGLISTSKRNQAADDWNFDPYTDIVGSTKDSRLSSICTAAKAQGIIVFSIGFEVTDDSADVLEDCASSASHFYRVSGLEITTAFQSIANAIGKLRLTQ